MTAVAILDSISDVARTRLGWAGGPLAPEMRLVEDLSGPVGSAYAQVSDKAGEAVICYRSSLGDDVVKQVQVRGPAAPSWRRGARRVSGRGPRDTYG